MAIVKPIKVRVGNLAGLRGVLDYIKADFKTKDGALVFGKDCFPQKAFEQMAITEKAFQKDSGRQYAHFVQSFYRYDDLTPEQALEIGQKFMARYERFKDFQVCAAVHTNGPQLHIHYVVNSVSHIDGHKWQSSKEDLKQMRGINFNSFVLDEAWHDFPLVSEVLGLLGAIDHPGDTGIYERTFLAQLNPEDFKGKTKLQIEQMLTERKHQELLAAQSRAIRERIAAEQAQGSLLTQSIAGLCEEFLYWLELAVMFGAFYGLRRSEIVGLKWSVIDFTGNTITIRHTVTSCTVDGKRVTIAKDRTKTKSSMRTLPLVPQFWEYLLALKETQTEYRRLCGNSYSKKYLEYIYVDELGERMSPDYITTAFPKLLEKAGMRKIRFHDTRHPYVNPTLKNILRKKTSETFFRSLFSITNYKQTVYFMLGMKYIVVYDRIYLDEVISFLILKNFIAQIFDQLICLLLGFNFNFSIIYCKV